MTERGVVGDRIFSNYEFLRSLAKTSSARKRTRLLKKATDDELLAVVEIAANVLKSNFPLTKRQLTKLMPHADAVRKLSRSRSVKGTRKVVQTGGGSFIPSLLFPVLVEVGRQLLSSSK